MYVVPLLAVGLLGTLAYIYILTSTERWIIVAIIVHLVMFLRPPHATTSFVAGATYSVVVFPGLIIWFIKKFFSDEKIVENWGELTFLIFVAIALMGVVLARVNGYSISNALKEASVFIPYLILFPIREVVAEKGEEKILWTLLAVGVVAAVYDVVKYRLSLSAAQFFWQVIGSRELGNEPLFMSSLLILFGFWAAKRYNQFGVLFLIAVNAIALVLSFSRGYWIGAFLGLSLLLLITRGTSRKRIAQLCGISLFSMALVSFMLFPRIFLDIIGGIGSRVAHTGLSDPSLANRLAESAGVIKYIKRSPIVGYGMGASFSFYNLLYDFTDTGLYVHNAYLYLLFKSGLVGLVTYLLFYLYMITSTFMTALKSKVITEKTMLLSFVSIMSVMMVVSLSSPQFYERVPVLILTVLWGISAGKSKKYRLAAEYEVRR